VSTPELVLVGATGYTGRLVARTLLRRGVPFTIAGRDESSLLDLIAELQDTAQPHPPPIGHRVVDIESHSDVDSIAGPEHVVLSCAGPFHLIGHSLARAVARRGGTYADISGEEPFVAWLMKELAVPARTSGALLIPSCAFESFVSDMLADRLCSREAIYREIASYYQLGSHATSPGTALTMRLVPHWEPAAFVKGDFVATGPGEIRRSPPHPGIPEGQVAVFAPYPEVRFWGTQYPTASALSFLVLGRSEAALLGRSARSGAADKATSSDVTSIVARHRRRTRPGPAANRRSSQRFTVMVQAIDETGDASEMAVEGSDPYGLSAEILTWVGRELVEDNAGGRVTGVRAPSEVFDADRFFDEARGWEPALVLR